MAGSSDVDLARGMVHGYVDHLEERDHVGRVFDLLGVDRVLGLLAEMVADGDADEVRDATLFVRDVFLIMPPHGFRRAYDRSALAGALQDRVYDPVPRIREACVYTLGKTCHRRSSGHLDEAFPWYLEHAPLELDRLLFELRWLGGGSQPRWYHLRRTAAAPLWVTRWAALGLVAEAEAHQRSLVGPEVQVLRRLAQDPHTWVRDEARWVLDARRGGPPHRGRRAYEQRRAAGDPYPTFFALELAVGHYLGVSGEIGYDADLCTAVGRRLQARPIDGAYDRDDYWRPLVDVRRSR